MEFKILKVLKIITEKYFNNLKSKPMETLATSTTLRSWNTQVKRTTTFFNTLSNEDWYKEVAPGRNTAIYLIGHLIVASDTMIEIFGFGSRRHPELDIPFMKMPDKSGQQFPPVENLLEQWQNLHDFLNQKFAEMDAENWLGKHNAMTDQEYERDPLRNKLSVLIGRTLHQNYHLGQLNFLHINS